MAAVMRASDATRRLSRTLCVQASLGVKRGASRAQRRSVALAGARNSLDIRGYSAAEGRHARPPANCRRAARDISESELAMLKTRLLE